MNMSKLIKGFLVFITILSFIQFAFGEDNIDFGGKDYNKAIHRKWVKAVYPIFSFIVLLIIIACAYKNIKYGLIAGIIIGGVIFMVVTLIGFHFDQCVQGHGSVRLEVFKLGLNGVTTDNNLFGHDNDEIVVKLNSGICKHKSPEYSYHADQQRYMSESIYSMYDSKITIQLDEQDSGFYGKNDLSDKYEVSKEVLASLRYGMKQGIIDHYILSHVFVVKGGNIFTENPILGLIASNLCVSVFDVLLGPVGSKLVTSLGSAKVLKYYQKVQDATETFDKYTSYKAILLDNVMSDAKLNANKPGNGMSDELLQMVLSYGTDAAFMTINNGSNADESINELFLKYAPAIGDLIKAQPGSEDFVGGISEVIDIMDTVVDTISEISDTLEICLDELIGKAVDAKYISKMAVTLPKP